MRARTWLLGVVALAGWMPSALHAAVITVNTKADVVANDGFCSLREAISAANTNTASGAAPGECGAGEPTDPITGLPATCGKLAAFLHQVAAAERRGELTRDQAAQLRRAAEGVRTDVGCASRALG